MKVLIIEDDREIVEVVSLAFKIRWPEVKLVSTHLGERGVELVESENPDVIILDLGLVDISGFEVLQQIRLFSAVPILILTVRSDEADIVKGLEWGADDYMVKPFRQLELLSRIRALTRRASPAAKETLLVCGQLRFDPSTRQLFYGDREIGLTRSEASILQHLMRNAGQVVTYSSLAEAVWGEDYPDATESLRVYIRRLREKLETEPGRPQIILTKTGVGYSLVKPG
ncbi:MAG: response regulator transcription factor [Chloroflexi bacterium]|nr:response regulator transcription factor [Chloroflexota bacterium]